MGLDGSWDVAHSNPPVIYWGEGCSLAAGDLARVWCVGTETAEEAFSELQEIINLFNALTPQVKGTIGAAIDGFLRHMRQVHGDHGHPMISRLEDIQEIFPPPS